MKFIKRMSTSISKNDYIKFNDFLGTHIGEVVSRETYKNEVRIDILVLHSTCKPRMIPTWKSGGTEFTLKFPDVKQGDIYTKFFRKTTKIETNW